MAYDPNDPLGTDFDGVEDLNANLSPASGRKMLAQAVLRRWLTNPGELFYAADYGAGLRRLISGSTDNIGAVPALLENQALKDERVEACRVSMSVDGDSVTFRAELTDSTGPFPLIFSLSKTGAISVEILDAA